MSSPASKQAMQRPHASVLLVEDNPDHALLAKVAISRLDEVREVRVVADGIQALELLRNGPRPDVVLLDLRLPRLDGFALLAELRRDPALSDLPVVVLSTSKADRDRAQVEALGITAYLVKPLAGPEFRDVLHAMG